MSRQSANLTQMVHAASTVKARLEKAEKEGAKRGRECESMKTEIESLKRYNSFVDTKLAETTEAEENANLKILKLLDDVKALTFENQ